jgi:SAM-dependent methyltransferase
MIMLKRIADSVPRSFKELTMNIADCQQFLDHYKNNASPGDQGYLAIHQGRYLITLNNLPAATHPNEFALELGTYGPFMVGLANLGAYARVEGTIFYPKQKQKIHQLRYSYDPLDREYRCYNLDLEKELVPIEDGVVDCIVCCELLEHLTSDPMFLMQEINRLLKPNGRLLLSTPNANSAGNIERILKGDVANYFHYFNREFSSDRHNFEYPPVLLRELIEAAGMHIDRLWTEYNWTLQWPHIIKLCSDNGFDTEMRGDTLFLIARKVGPVRDRFPAGLYLA